MTGKAPKVRDGLPTNFGVLGSVEGLLLELVGGPFCGPLGYKVNVQIAVPLFVFLCSIFFGILHYWVALPQIR